MIRVLKTINIKPLLASYFLLEHNISWTNYGHKGRQAGLQYKTGEDPWSSAVGPSQGQELTYTNLNPFFKNTVFEDIINEFGLSRTRLMWVGPYACYSMHVDSTSRIHIPLITNQECYFVFKEGIIEHMPIGSVYWTDTKQRHTFMNCSTQHRLHLVGVVD